MRLHSDALGRCALEEPRARPRFIRGLPVAIPSLPQAAYRLLLELLWREPSFCYYTLPYFHTNGYISLLVCDGGRNATQEESADG